MPVHPGLHCTALHCPALASSRDHAGPLYRPLRSAIGRQRLPRHADNCDLANWVAHQPKTQEHKTRWHVAPPSPTEAPARVHPHRCPLGPPSLPLSASEVSQQSCTLIIHHLRKPCLPSWRCPAQASPEVSALSQDPLTGHRLHLGRYADGPLPCVILVCSRCPCGTSLERGAGDLQAEALQAPLRSPTKGAPGLSYHRLIRAHRASASRLAGWIARI